MCHSGSGMCAVCKTIKILVALVFFILALAALAGVYQTHYTPAGFVFGTSDCSFAIIALVASLLAWHKTTKGLCPCSRKSCGTGCGCGGACACGKENCDCGDKKMMPPMMKK